MTIDEKIFLENLFDEHKQNLINFIKKYEIQKLGKYYIRNFEALGNLKRAYGVNRAIEFRIWWCANGSMEIALVVNAIVKYTISITKLNDLINSVFGYFYDYFKKLVIENKR